MPIIIGLISVLFTNGVTVELGDGDGDGDVDWNGDEDGTEDGRTSKTAGAIGEVGKAAGCGDEKADSEAAGKIWISSKSSVLGNSKSGGLSAGNVLVCKSLRLLPIK